MRLTDEMVLQDNKRFEMCNALAELKYCGWEIPQRKSITNDEIRFYAWLCRSAVELLKEQEKEIDEISDEYLDLGNEMAKQPKPKTGHWLKKMSNCPSAIAMGGSKISACDLCGGWGRKTFQYCPHCGAKMEKKP